jgi:predicted DNA binding CopG/RHH family protein
MVRKLANSEKLPVFAKESSEAEWWYENRERIEDNLADAIASGTAQRGTAQRSVKDARLSKNITIRLSLEDLGRARRLSATRGLAYQTYIKMLLHEALDREENRRVS